MHRNPLITVSSLTKFLVLLASVVSTAAALDEPPKPLPLKSRVDGPRALGQLQIRLPAFISRERKGDVDVRLRNMSRTPLTLVMPGDGSFAGFRTPYVGWSVLPVDSTENHPAKVSFGNQEFCPVIRPMKPEDIFILKPGQTIELSDRFDAPYGIRTKPGRYRVVLYYSNIPTAEWRGTSVPDNATMERIRKSTPLALRSNEVFIEVTE